jgi:hypothetical protein
MQSSKRYHICKQAVMSKLRALELESPWAEDAAQHGPVELDQLLLLITSFR